MTFNLEGKVAIVTGGGAGIGNAIVNLLVAEGALVVTADRDLSQLQGLDVVRLNTDLASHSGGPRLVDLAIETHGRLDIVVNAVGGLVPRVGGFTEITDEDWDWTLDLNLRCMIRTTRAALPHLIERGGGSIVSIASDQGRQPDPLFGDYAVAKAGVLSVSKIISLEYAKHGIRSNAVSPGPTLTPGFSAGFVEMASAWDVTLEEAIHRFVHEIRKIPIGRLGDPQDIANVVCFLASDLARNVTGSEYCADGGITVAA